jgi:L-alanine-DL-glutamate epimerase-like enolase superfamily enzyme
VKITGVDTFPVRDGKRNYLFLVVVTDEGLYGVGEAGLTGRELAVMGTIDHFQPLLLGVPVYELLGGRARDRVVCYPHNAEAGMDTSALVESISRPSTRPERSDAARSRAGCTSGG